MSEEIKRKPGQRGKGKRPAMTHVSIRIPTEVVDFYKRDAAPSTLMRKVLVDYANERK